MIGFGGEAIIYEGSYQGHAVVVRVFHPPDTGEWASPGGRAIRQVQDSDIASLVVINAGLIFVVDHTRMYCPLAATTSEHSGTTGHK